MGFFSRFYLDTRITDLDDEIEQKQIVIKSYSSFEREFKRTQSRLDIFKVATSEQNNPLPILTKVVTRVPVDIFFTQLMIDPKEVRIEASSLSEQAIAQYIVNLQTQPELTNIHLVQLNTQKGLPLVGFSLSNLKEEDKNGSS
jgi:hypothetical protein